MLTRMVGAGSNVALGSTGADIVGSTYGATCGWAMTVAGVAWWALSKPKKQTAIAEPPAEPAPAQLPNPYAPPPVVVIKANP